MEVGSSAPLVVKTLLVKNKTIVCQNPNMINSKSYWSHDNPLNYSSPLLMLQLSLISVISQFINLCLEPLGQSRIVSQIVGGIILGPSVLGNKKNFESNLFPLRGVVVLETLATFGLMLFMFLSGVKMDPSIMKKSGCKAMTIGVSVFFFSLVIPSAISFILKRHIPMAPSLAHCLPFVAASQSLTGFPVVASLLTDLKILNTDLGRIAISSSMFTDIIGLCLLVISFSAIQINEGHILIAIWAMLSSIGMVAGIVFLVRPVMLWILKQTSEGKSVQEVHIFAIFCFILVAGFVSEVIGQNIVLGPLVLGLVVPDGPPLGVAVVERLDSFVSGLLYPAYLSVSGLKTNIFAISYRTSWIIGFIVILASLVKIGAVILPALYCRMPIPDAVIVGLILNAKGIIEISIYNFWMESKILGEQEFALMVISVLGFAAIITPLTRALYDPSKRRYIPLKRTTIRNARQDSEFRLLVCIHNQDNVSTMVNLLQVSNGTKASPVTVILVLLVELVGRATPLFIPYRPFSPYSSISDHVFNAFRHYELHNGGFVTIKPFVAVSHLATVHDDLCQVALNERVTILILPFHKQWSIDGSLRSVNCAIRAMNLNVLNKAPCSVGILVDRALLTGSLPVLNSQRLYRVGVLFFGGADDEEALAYCARMAKHERVSLTVVRFLLLGRYNGRERKLDGDVIDEFRKDNIRNEEFVYVEEVIEDGEGVIGVIRGMEVGFDLIVVGRHHQLESPLFSGLNEWSECMELGILGDILASSDFRSTASVLVVQQQARVAGNNVSS